MRKVDSYPPIFPNVRGIVKDRSILMPPNCIRSQVELAITGWGQFYIIYVLFLYILEFVKYFSRIHQDCDVSFRSIGPLFENS